MTPFRIRRLLVLAITALAFVLSSSGTASRAAAPRSDEQSALRQLADQLPETTPWPITHVFGSDGTVVQLDKPVSSKRDVIRVMQLAMEGKLPGAATPALTQGLSQLGTFCGVGTGWNQYFPGTFLIQYGTTFVCSAATEMVVLDRFGLSDPVFGEFAEFDRNGTHAMFTSYWVHTKVINEATNLDLAYCAVGSGSIFFAPPQPWILADCHPGLF